MLDAMMWRPALWLARAVPIRAMLLDSEPPEVKRISLSFTFRVFATWAAARFTAFSARTPMMCLAEGLP